MPIESLDQIAVPAFNPQRPDDSKKQAIEALNAAFELASRKKGAISITQLHLKFHAHFPREEIAQLERNYQKRCRADLGMFGKKGMRAQLEYLEYGVREYLLALRAKNPRQVNYIIVKKALEGINRGLQERGATLGIISPKAAELVFSRINAELGHPVRAIYRDLAHFGKATGPAPRLSTRSRTNIERTKRHPPPH